MEQFHSRFGGFWTDRIDAHAVLRERFRAGSLTQQQHDDLQFWIKNGYLIKKGACDAATIDQAQAAIYGAVDSGSRMVSYWDATGKHTERISTREQLQHAEAKLLDVHSMREVQQLAFSQPIVDFLKLVFGEPAIAFQSLYFEKGSEQGAHQDTAFVYVDSALKFVATWIAMEDITPGSGELLYFPGSHKVPERLFSDGTKKITADAAETYTRDLIKACTDAGLSQELFCPRRGDVLFWAADLVHGGSPRRTTASRRSLVTHYCPASCRPPFAAGKNPESSVREQLVLTQT